MKVVERKISDPDAIDPEEIPDFSPDTTEGRKYSMDFVELNCVDRKMRSLKRTAYSADGKVIGSNTEPER